MLEYQEKFPVIVQSDFRIMADKRKRYETEAMRQFWKNLSGQKRDRAKNQNSEENPTPKTKPTIEDIYEREISSAKYYTAVTRRSKEAEKPPTFDALNRKFVPLPQLFDRHNPGSEYHRKTDARLKMWEKEIVKPAGRRPAFSVPAGVKTPDLEEMEKDDIRKGSEVLATRSMFYNPKDVYKVRNYSVSPEWFSEKIPPGKYIRAHKTTFKIGW